MQTQMNQTLQALRGEIEAVATLQLALNRIALTVDDNSLSVWDGPRPEDVDDVAGDDGSFSREAVVELRAKAGEALARRYKEVEQVILGRAALESLVRSTLTTGTGGVITSEGGPPPNEVLSALARSGALRLDWAQEAAAQVREVLEAKAASKAPPRPTVPATPKAKVGKKAKARPLAVKKKKPVAKTVAKKKPVSRKPVAKKKKKAVAKKKKR